MFQLQGVLNYRDLDYRNPRNTGIYKKFQVICLSGLFTTKSLQYRDPDNRGLGFFFRLSGTFSGPSHPDNRGPTVDGFLPAP